MIETVKEQRSLDTSELTGYLVNNTMSVPLAEGNRDYQEIQQWITEGNVPEPAFTAEQLQAQLRADITSAIQNMLDSKAKEYEFDDIKSARAQSSVVVPAHITDQKLIGAMQGIIDMAKSLADWELQCWATSTIIRQDVTDGIRPVPTVDEVFAEMPEFI